MTRARRSLFGPMAFAFCSLVFAAGAGYAWWLDHRARAPAPLREVRAATLPALVAAPSRPSVTHAAVSPAPGARASVVVRKCLGADGVPIYTSTDCPAGATLVSESAFDVPRDAARAPATHPAPSVVANASATVVNHGGGYAIPDRRFRRDVERERAWDRCERGKVRAEAELAALQLRRKMSDIRRWEQYVVHECAPYEVLAK